MIWASVSLEFKNLLVVAAVIVFAMVLAFRLMNRDSTIWRSRWGFFVERDRYPGDDGETETETKEWPNRKEDL